MFESMKQTSEEVRARIKVANERYKEQANKKRSATPPIAAGDLVWLNRKNISTTRLSKKLDYKFLGPYKVLEAIGKNASHLKLPHQLKIHNVFHVSLLEKHTEDTFDRAPAPVPPVEVEGEEEWEVEKILNSRLVRNKVQFKVRWLGFGPELDQWEPKDHLSNAQDKIDQFYSLNPYAPKEGEEITTHSGRKTRKARP